MPEASPQPPRPRIGGLSDLIFGLALSMGAIQMVTTQSPPQNGADLAAVLAAFGFSFLFLINIWNRYTVVMSAMPVETTLLVRLNMLLLFLVVVEPYLFNLMFTNIPSSPAGQAVSSFIAIDVGTMDLVLAYFTHALTDEERNLIPKELMWLFRASRNTLLLGGAHLFFSDLPAWWTIVYMGIPVRVLIWFLAVR